MVEESYIQNKQRLCRTFQQEGKIQLLDIFQQREYLLLLQKVRSLSFQRLYQPLRGSYAVAKVPLSLLKAGGLPAMLEMLLGKKVALLRAHAYLLRWKDYSLLHDEAIEGLGVDFLLDLTEGWKQGWGGAVVYTDGQGNYAPVMIKGNSLTVVQRNREQKFMQYVNHHAKGEERLIVMGKVEFRE